MGVGSRRRAEEVARAIALLAGGAGCLFPDFGKLDDRGSAATGTDGGSVREIACEPDAGCPTASKFCCNTIGGKSCQDLSGLSSPAVCGIQGAGVPGKGKALLCDGVEDCDPGQLCCFSDVADGDGVNARCRNQCGATEKVVCNTTTQSCPNGSSCNGTVAAGDFRICQ